jgi:hypothetical protein
MAINVNSNKPAFPRPLFDRLVSCFPIRCHGRYMYCMFEDEMKEMKSIERVATMLDEIRDHFPEQDWDYASQDDLSILQTVKILKQAVSVYGFIIGRNQTTTNGVQRKYFFFAKPHEVIKHAPFSTLKVHHKRTSLTF